MEYSYNKYLCGDGRPTETCIFLKFIAPLYRGAIIYFLNLIIYLCVRERDHLYASVTCPRCRRNAKQPCDLNNINGYAIESMGLEVLDDATAYAGDAFELADRGTVAEEALEGFQALWVWEGLEVGNGGGTGVEADEAYDLGFSGLGGAVLAGGKEGGALGEGLAEGGAQGVCVYCLVGLGDVADGGEGAGGMDVLMPAAIGIGVEVGDGIEGQGCLVDIAQHIVEAGGVFYGFTVEAATVDGAVAVVLIVDIMGVVGCDARHSLADGVLTFLDEEVEVVGHEAVGIDAEAGLVGGGVAAIVLLAKAGEDIDELLAVFVVFEDVGLADALHEDVVYAGMGLYAELARHDV